MVSEVTLSEVSHTPEVVADDLRPVLLRLTRELRKESEQLGVTVRQATLLWLVKRSPGLSLAERLTELDQTQLEAIATAVPALRRLLEDAS